MINLNFDWYSAPSIIWTSIISIRIGNQTKKGRGIYKSGRVPVAKSWMLQWQLG